MGPQVYEPRPGTVRATSQADSLKIESAREIDVRRVRSRRERKAFVQLPWRIYRDDAQWVPPLLAERREFISPRHPFLRHGAAELFVAWSKGQPVGRILVSDDPRFNDEQGANVGWFGMFESIDDDRVAAALLDTAADWLRRRGRTCIMGPADYSTNYTCGLLTSGFNTPPRVMMNHNPPYYQRLVESWGLSKAKDLLSWWFSDSSDIETRWRRRAERLAERGSIRIRAFRTDDFDAEVERCRRIYNEAWLHNWGFVRMSDAEFTHFARQMLRIAIPGLLLFAEVDGQPVGFSVTLPDMNEAFRPLDGRLFRWGLPIGLWQLHRNYRRIKTGRLVALGVLEKYRRRGVSEMLILKTFEHGKDVVGLTGAELGWTLEDNDLINRTIQSVGAVRYKTYRIYERAI